MKFNVESEDVVVGILPLEGENTAEMNGERLTTIESEKHDVNIEAPDAEIPATVPEAIEGRGKRIRKETEYMKMLKDGSAVTGSRVGGTLPRGM